ncbi:hypothetical protein CR513_21963, partial [Mucuna pruriens]
MREVHKGVCKTHIKDQALASKVAKDHANLLYIVPILSDVPEGNITLALSTWGVDILGPFPLVVRQVKFLKVTMDYFTKWVEVEPIATISTERIICRFDLPSVIVLDNDTQFTFQLVIEFCSQLKIKQVFTSIKHPQSNVEAESANKIIKAKGGKRQIGGGITPSALVIPHYPPIPPLNEEKIRANLDLLQEIWEVAHMKEIATKLRADRQYNAKVFPRKLKKQDLVLRKVLRNSSSNKLTLNWEDPYIIVEEVGKGAFRYYKMQDVSPGKGVKNTKDLREAVGQ